MGVDLFFAILLMLIISAVLNLLVGVTNDAVNFLNASLGSRAAPRHIIMILASLGILTGVTFSSGMMEVARKGIFHPQLFTMPELMIIFLAVMFTNIILLDVFNTYALPTSTTVSVVFALLGAAVAVGVIKITQTHQGLLHLYQYINTAKAMVIIFGILFSVVVAFICGSVVQVLSRMLFTFDYASRLRRYGALWGGLAMACITYFMLIKGVKGAAFVSGDTAVWIESNTFPMMAIIFATSAIILQFLLFLKVNILRPIVLMGTFALAMAFAANDLVNFIGVPLAGLHAYRAAIATDDPLHVTMDALGQRVPSETGVLLIAGLIMVIALWFSRKARSVTETEIRLGHQGEGLERFEASFLSRSIVRMGISLFETAGRLVPRTICKFLAHRTDVSCYRPYRLTDEENRPSFDLIRASVNLMVASVVISYATSQKLPLSTTYVTFMVAMGTSFADRAWGRESAVYRVSGVLTVIGGWFFTALSAFTVSCGFAALLFYTKAYAALVLPFLVGYIIWKAHHKHKDRVKTAEDRKVFNLRKVTDPSLTVAETFNHMAYLAHEIRESLEKTLDALFAQNTYGLRLEEKKIKKIQLWVNIITANVFKAMRLLDKSDAQRSRNYAQTIRLMQKLADGHRDIVMRSLAHVSNHHAGLLDIQVEELREVKAQLLLILSEVEDMFLRRRPLSLETVREDDRRLRELADVLNQKQIPRIVDESSKTRLTILYYAIVGNAMRLSKQNLKLLRIFSESFTGIIEEEFDLE